MLTVRGLLADEALGLRLLAGQEAAASSVVEAAHVCELRRPGPWLQGGELLMTIGILLPEDAAGCREYVRHLLEWKVSALALGLGRELPYQSAPVRLVDAAEAEGLPLLTVPDEVPFIAVTKAVFAARASQERRELEASMTVHRSLTAAAASARGLDGLLAAWWPTCQVPAMVVDPGGRPLASIGCAVEDAGEGVGRLMDRAAVQGLRGFVQGRVDGVDVELHPLGAERLRGAVVLVGVVTRLARQVLPALVSMLSLELERRHLADEPRRRARALRLRRLLSEPLSDEDALELLAAAGVVGLRFRGVAVATPHGLATDVAADLALALSGGLVAVRGDVVVAVAVEDVDLVTVARRFAPGLPVGIGPAVRPGAVAGSVEQALAALAMSARLGRPAVAEEAGSLRLLLSLGDDGLVAGFADSVLAPIDTADHDGQLARTLTVWLGANGSWEEAASALGVHRHTVRNRVSRVEQLTGRDLSSAAERHELWLALRARDVVPGGRGR